MRSFLLSKAKCKTIPLSLCPLMLRFAMRVKRSFVHLPIVATMPSLLGALSVGQRWNYETNVKP